MPHKTIRLLTTSLAAVVAAALLQAAPASAATSCLSVPSDPALTSAGSHAWTAARNDCGALTVLWLVREATATQPRTVQERYVHPGSETTVLLDCRRTGTREYRAMVWDPNMMFRRTSQTVTLTC